MKTRKFTALLLVLCLLLTAVPYSAPAVYATEDEHLAQEQPQEQTQTKLIDAPLLVEGTDLPTRANSNFFKYVDDAVFEAGNHVARIPEEETLSTYVFRNNDGTKTVYYLPDNVKYFAQDGTVVEKDLTLVAKTGGYGVSRSDIGYTLPTNASSGIQLTHGTKTVGLIPQNQNAKASKAAVVDGSIRYANYFGTGIHLVYTPIPSGLKEDIVLDSYTGQYSFTFLLNTNGMRLYQEDGQYYLATSAEAEEKMYLGQIVVYDAKGEPCPGTMSITTIAMGQQYRITVSADPDFLTNPNTEYPVTIDPSLTISDSTQSGAIEDASVYENKPTVNAGSWTYNHCGYYTSSSTVYGVSRTVYRLTGLINDTTWASIDPADIVSAKLYVKEASGKSGITLNIRALSNTTWTETGITWNTLGGHYTTVYASSAPGYGAWGEWDITGLAIAWKYLTRSIQAGFEMVSEDEFTESRTLYASEYGTVDRRPYFTVTYNYDTDGLSITQKEISVGNSFVLYWPDVTAPITWHSSNTAVATVSSTGVVTGINPGIATITASADNYTSRTCTVYVLLKDGVYYISSAHSISLGTGGTQTNLSHMKTYTKATSGTERYHQLWEINHISNGRYSIRSIGNGNLLLSRDEDYAVGLMQSASLTVPTQARWTIEYTSMGYRILNAGNSDYALTVNGSKKAPNQQVKTVSYAQNSYEAHWILAFVTGVFLIDSTRTSIAVTEDAYIEFGTTQSFSQLGITALVSGRITGSEIVTWSTGSASIAPATNYGTITGAIRAKTTITAQVTIGGQPYTDTCPFKVVETISVINLYDCTVAGQNDIIDSIDEAVDFLNIVYDDFCLRFVMDGAPMQLAPIDDHIAQCPAGADSACECSTICEEHHKNMARIAKWQTERYFESNHIVVNWSDCAPYVYCSYTGAGVCTPHGGLAHVPPRSDLTKYPVIFVMRFEDFRNGGFPNVTLLEYMGVVLAHEVAHILGLKEVYNDMYSDCPNTQEHSGASIPCLMAKFEKNVSDIHDACTNGSPFCAFCESKLNEIIAPDILTTNS